MGEEKAEFIAGWLRRALLYGATLLTNHSADKVWNDTSTKKTYNLRFASCFIWGKMRTAAGEREPQRVLKGAPKRSCGKVNIQDSGEGGVQCLKCLPYKKIRRWWCHPKRI